MMEERRKFKRYPVLHEIDKTIQITIGKKVLPGVLVELSAGGMSLLTFASIAVGTELNLSLDLPGLKTQGLAGRVVWSLAKGEMWRLGIAFTTIDPIDFRHINRMAFDYSDCSTKLALGVSDVCITKCAYFTLCQRPEKVGAKHRAAE